MGVESSPDLILDVVRAADPTRATAVTERLSALGAQAGAVDGDFSDALSKANAASNWRPTSSLHGMSRAGGAPATKAEKMETKFEAMALTNLIDEMMPKDASDVYGQGLAGDTWRSMLAEKVADQLAQSGRLGIADRLFHGAHSAAQELTRTHEAQAGLAQTTLTSGNALSLPVAAEVGGDGVLFGRGKSI